MPSKPSSAAPSESRPHKCECIIDNDHMKCLCDCGKTWSNPEWKPRPAVSDESRERFDREELKRLIGEAVKYDLTHSDNPRLWLEMKDALDYAENNVRAAERDTLERCAQLVAKIQPYHAMVPADMDDEHMYKVGFADALRAVAERIRGKE